MVAVEMPTETLPAFLVALQPQRAPRVANRLEAPLSRPFRGCLHPRLELGADVGQMHSRLHPVQDTERETEARLCSDQAKRVPASVHLRDPEGRFGQ